MSAVVYVIDLEFTELFSDDRAKDDRRELYEDLTKTQIGEFYLITRPDGPDKDVKNQVSWESCINTLLADVAAYSPTRLVVLGHKGIFRDVMLDSEQQKVESRIRRAEKRLLELLPKPAPALSIFGFHHELQSSEIWRLLQKPEQLMVSGTLARLRSIVEEGGGPLGKLSALKHQLMRPFASVRLRLQIAAERGNRQLDPESIDRVAAAITSGHTALLEIRASLEPTHSFERALERARGLLEEDLNAITADADHFNGWIDRLNDALDAVRKEAR